MKLTKIEAHLPTGQIGLEFSKTLFDENGKEAASKKHREMVNPAFDNAKERLVELVGQDMADKLESIYWPEGFVKSAKENLEKNV